VGEAYFAEKLLDYEMSSNVGNWQWAAGTGCDATPYFRVFNPSIQLKKFDEKGVYISGFLNLNSVTESLW
jgi:deoxyribodipyrimidine photo-lyase